MSEDVSVDDLVKPQPDDQMTNHAEQHSLITDLIVAKDKLQQEIEARVEAGETIQQQILEIVENLGETETVIAGFQHGSYSIPGYGSVNRGNPGNLALNARDALGNRVVAPKEGDIYTYKLNDVEKSFEVTFVAASTQQVVMQGEIDVISENGDIIEVPVEKVGVEEHAHPELENAIQMSDDEPDNPEEGDLWYDTNRLEMFIRYDGGWITTTALGARVAEGEAIQRDLVARVAFGEEQQTILKHKVRALEGSIGEHPFAFSMSSNPRDGQMVMMNGSGVPTNVAADVAYILFSTTDFDGNPVDLGVLGEGDLLRVSSPDGGVVEFKSAADASSGQFLVGSVLRSDFDEFTADVVYGSTYLSQFDPSGLATITYVDDKVSTHGHNKYLTKSGMQDGTGTDWKLRMLHTSGGGGRQTYLDINHDELHLYHVADPTNPAHGASWGYIQDNTVAASEAGMGMWIGTQAQYEAIKDKSNTTLYVVI